jgi:hypothetical protein
MSITFELKYLLYLNKTIKLTSKIKVLVALSKDESGKPQVVQNLKGKTITGFVKNSIIEGSMIQIDAFHSYRKPLADKYLHEYQVFDSDSDTLHWLHIIIGNAKRLCIRYLSRSRI